MKLLDKIKDLFMDEVDVDDEIEIEEEQTEQPHKVVEKEKREENVLPKVMRDTIKQEEVTREEKTVKQRVSPDDFMKELNISREGRTRELPQEKKIELPPKRFTQFNDADLDVPSRNARSENVAIKQASNNMNTLDLGKETTKRVSELYPKKEEPKEKPKFKATPVISPVYGILDKNYTK